MSLLKRTLHTCITGIGNMEPQYCGTRHNVGNMIVRMIQQQLCPHSKFKTVPGFKGIQYVRDETQDNHIISLLICTGGYMNQIGRLVTPVWKRVKAQYWNTQFVVVHDELDKPLGHIQLREPGTRSRGHNGLKSLTACYGAKFYKLGIGIDRPTSRSPTEVANYVLDEFPKDSLTILKEVSLPRALQKLKDLSKYQ